jgi:hypothetical protein
MLSTTAFYLHTELVLTNRRLYAIQPNVFLGLIPVGSVRSNFPTENIAGVQASTRFAIGAVLVGLLSLLIGLAALAVPGVAVLAWLLIVLGFVMVIESPRQAIEVMNSGGGTVQFRVSFLERSRTVQFANQMSAALVRRAPTHFGATAPTFATDNDPADALRRLESLRSQRLITEDEYLTKRNEIIARL